MFNTQRTPNKPASPLPDATAQSSNEILKALQEMSKNLEDKIIASEVRTADKISTLEQTLIQKITELEEKTDQLARENSTIKEQNRLLSARISQIERANRRNNIMVTGAKISNLEEA